MGWARIMASGLMVGLCWVGSVRKAEAVGDHNLIVGSMINAPSDAGIVAIGNNITIAPGNTRILVLGDNMRVPPLPPGTIYVNGQVYRAQINGGIYEVIFPNNGQRFAMDRALYEQIRQAIPNTIAITANFRPVGGASGFSPVSAGTSEPPKINMKSTNSPPSFAKPSIPVNLKPSIPVKLSGSASLPKPKVTSSPKKR
jgi:hypothetical protein